MRENVTDLSCARSVGIARFLALQSSFITNAAEDAQEEPRSAVGSRSQNSTPLNPYLANVGVQASHAAHRFPITEQVVPKPLTLAATGAQASHAALWAMPIAQLGLLAFFCSVAAWRWWNNWALLVPCFITGVLFCSLGHAHEVFWVSHIYTVVGVSRIRLCPCSLLVQQIYACTASAGPDTCDEQRTTCMRCSWMSIL